MRLALLTLLALAACSWEPFAGPTASVPCHGYPPDTITAGQDTAFVVRAHKCGMPYLP